MVANFHLVARGDSILLRQLDHQIVQIKVRQLTIETFNLQVVEVDIEVLDLKVNRSDDVASLSV